MKRRFAVAVLAVALAAAPAAAVATQRVVLLIPGTLGSGPFYLAQERGYFQRFGIDAVIQREDSPTGLVTLNLGAADLFYFALRPAMFELAARGGRVRVVSGGTTVATRCTALALVVSTRFYREHGRFSFADLRGVRIGTNTYGEGGLAHIVLSRMLAAAGMTDRDVIFVRLPFPAQAAALESGGLDAAFIAEPFLSAVVTRGSAVIGARAQAVAGGDPVALNVAGPSLLRRPGVASRLLAGYLLGVRDYTAPDAKRNPDTVRILAKSFGQSEDTIRRSCWHPIRRDGRADVEKLTMVRDWYVSQGLLTEPVPMSRLMDDHFLREAWRLLEAIGERVR